MALPPTYGDESVSGFNSSVDSDRTGKIFVHTREDSNNSLEEMFRVVTEPGINYGLPFKERKLPKSFFLPPESASSTFNSPTSSVDSLCTSGKPETFLLQQFLNQSSLQNQDKTAFRGSNGFQQDLIAHSRAHSSPACLPIKSNQHQNQCPSFTKPTGNSVVERSDSSVGDSIQNAQKPMPRGHRTSFGGHSGNYSSCQSPDPSSGLSKADSVSSPLSALNNKFSFTNKVSGSSKSPSQTSYHSHQHSKYFGASADGLSGEHRGVFRQTVPSAMETNHSVFMSSEPQSLCQSQQDKLSLMNSLKPKVDSENTFRGEQFSAAYGNSHFSTDLEKLENKFSKLLSFEICPLPDGWELGYNDNKIYYIDHNKKITSWFDPRIPQDWQSGWGHSASEMSNLHLLLFNKLKRDRLNNLTAQKEILRQQLENTTRNEFLMRQEVLSMQSAINNHQLHVGAEHHRQESSDSGLAPEPTFTPPLQETNGGNIADPVACIDDLYPSLNEADLGLTVTDDVDMVVHFREDFPASFV